jgi:aryl-alcohol dehydrogenase-like predicted oxidoreductase
METRRIGDRTVSAIGLGAMPLSITGRPDRDGARATVHASLNAGVTLVDTADAYSESAGDFGRGEEVVADALAAWGGSADDVLVATKGGHTRGEDGSWGLDGSPEYLRRACEASLRRLGVQQLGLYQFHRPDPQVPLADTVGALGEILDAGLAAMVGVSNFDADEIRAAHAQLGGRLASVQNQFSPAFRSSRGEIDVCAELGVAFLPWSPLGGMSAASGLGTEHAEFDAVAREHGVSPQQVALAWELAQSPVVVPIPGSSRPASATASAAATELVLTPAQLARLDGA